MAPIPVSRSRKFCNLAIARVPQRTSITRTAKGIAKCLIEMQTEDDLEFESFLRQARKEQKELHSKKTVNQPPRKVSPPVDDNNNNNEQLDEIKKPAKVQGQIEEEDEDIKYDIPAEDVQGSVSSTEAGGEAEVNVDKKEAAASSNDSDYNTAMQNLDQGNSTITTPDTSFESVCLPQHTSTPRAELAEIPESVGAFLAAGETEHPEISADPLAADVSADKDEEEDFDILDLFESDLIF